MYTKNKFKNGLTLITTPLKETKAVTVLILFPVGSRYEAKNINGVSHFIEHLMFKGTKKRPTSLDITKELDSIGAEYNAYTSKDHTGYYIKTASENIKLAFDILSDMIFNSVFDSKEIQKERGVIIEEINMYEDNPMMFLPAMFEQTLFGDNSLGQLISGPKSVIKNISRDEILKYRDAYYHSGNIVISIAGNFNKDQINKLCRQYFPNNLKKGKKTSFPKIKINQSKPRVKLKFKETEQVQLGLGLTSYPLDDPRLFALFILSVILGGNMSSRLFTVVREQHGLAYYIRTSLDNYKDISAFLVQAGLDKEKTKEAISLILSELKRIKSEGVTDQELKSAKNFLKGKLVLDLEDSSNVADWFANQELFSKKIYTPKQKMKKFLAVTSSQVKKVAQELFIQKKLNLAIIGPFKNEGEFEKLLKL